jgi:hypothetical protein
MDFTVDEPRTPENPQREPGYRNPEEKDRPINDRLGRDPGNLGDDVVEGGDLVYPAPEPEAPHM